MLGINRIITTNVQLQRDYDSKHKLAESLQQSAATHSNAGDEVHAEHEQKSAERYLNDASELESQITSNQVLIATLQQKKANIKKQMEDTTRIYEKDMDKLNSELDAIS